MSDNRNATCAERLPDQLASRIGHIDTLGQLASVYDHASLREACGGNIDAVLNAVDLEHVDREPDEIAEAAREALGELPLAVSARTVFRIDLSTGGPADWLEVFCDGDTPLYEPAAGGEHFEIVRVVYHFADWFDHAECDLQGDERETAERFASYVVPELVG